MNGGAVGLDYPDNPEFVEVDPSCRYGRYNEILGKGASKTVYRGFDEYEGIEVAWNQVKVCDILQSPEDLERLYCEIHLLKTLKHPNIMKFYTSWVDTANRNINFVTEMFTSGTLRQYRLKHKRINIRAIKQWCRQILRGLHYLHSRDPPIIHRDLKCDNIFINGNQGEVKIGDLGLAAILRKSHADHCVGTPEFMAPEVYEEEYNELVDIYSFGMCILEMVSLEYPYSECSHPAQIYKKVISGKKPNALYNVKDPEVRQFIDKCLASVSDRLSAWELLNDPFLQTLDYVYDSCPSDYRCKYSETGSVMTHRLHSVHHSTASSFANGYTNLLGYEQENDFNGHSVGYEADELDLFASEEDKHLEKVDVTIEGGGRDDDNIFLRLRIADKEGRIRNIYFPFDIKADTALIVAAEMVSELDITNQDMTKIAEMIDAEIASLVPHWKIGSIGESQDGLRHSYCHHCAEYLSSTNPSGQNLQVLQCLNGCGAVHGRFEEITYQVEGSEQCIRNDDAHSTLSENMHFTDIWALHEGCTDSQHNNAPETSGQQADEESVHSMTTTSALAKDYENEIRQEIRWLKATYQMQLSELRDQRLGVALKSSSQYSDSKRVSSTLSLSTQVEERIAHNPSAVLNIALGKELYAGHLLPHSLHRATSLPVDATEM